MFQLTRTYIRVSRKVSAFIIFKLRLYTVGMLGRYIYIRQAYENIHPTLVFDIKWVYSAIFPE